MTNGSRTICAAVGCVVPWQSGEGSGPALRDNNHMAHAASNAQLDWPHARLRKHADFQRVYKASRKRNSTSMSYFFRVRAEHELTPDYAGPRVGLTAGRVLGKAVERNRIKRRMRDVARRNLTLLPQLTDVVLHPRRVVLDIEFTKLEREMAKIFITVCAEVCKAKPDESGAKA